MQNVRAEWPRWIVQQLVNRGIHDERVLRAIRDVPRSRFVSLMKRGQGEADAPITIGCGQTVSQPYIIALSLQALALEGHERVLDVGTGSGWQAALLSHLAAEVYTIELHQRLFTNARLLLEREARAPVHCRQGDGSRGWPEAAPFEAIVVGARAPRVPQALVDQLAPGGRLVIPLGSEHAQTLYCITKDAGGALHRQYLERVMFVPLVESGGREAAGG